MIKCPNCGNDNGGLLETLEHRREQMRVHCNVCSKDWTEVFANIPPEKVPLPINDPRLTERKVDKTIKKVYGND